MTIESLLKNPDIKEKFTLQKLLCYFLDYTKEELRFHLDEEIDADTKEKILQAYEDIATNNKPIEYVIWYVEFFNKKFYVDENTLIPRPETEYMIKAVREEIDNIRKKELHQEEEVVCKVDDVGIGNPDSCNILLDIGTGCGVLGTSVLLQNPGFFCRAIFTDFSEKALDIAQQNYEILIKDHDFPVEFIQSDLLDFLLLDTHYSFTLDPSGSLGTMILVANLPYIPEDTFEKNVADKVKKREPKMAFVGGDDGLIYYRKMLNQITELQDAERQGDSNVLTFWGSVVLFLEMMTRQIDILRQEYKEKFSFEEVKTFHFNIRIVKVTMR